MGRFAGSRTLACLRVRLASCRSAAIAILLGAALPACSLALGYDDVAFNHADGGAEPSVPATSGPQDPDPKDPESTGGTGGESGQGGASFGGSAGSSQQAGAGGSTTGATNEAYTVTVVDYFTGNSVDGVTATVDGASADPSDLKLAEGVHPIAITAPGYAIFNNAIQVPGGATSRTVQLFPVTTSITNWLALINSDRQANGVSPVKLDNGLMIAAWDHAVDMGVQGYFAHFDPHGFAPSTRSLMLGAMLMGAENLAAGQANFEQAEQDFMGERASLPTQSPGDCAASYELAGHYCNLIWASHNWVGLSIANVPGSPYANYFDQEFGDLYGYYDTTVLGPEPPIGKNAPLALIPAPGENSQYEFVQTMPAPTPISIATLNADPTCASSCPAADPWFPSGNTYVSSQQSKGYTPPLDPAHIVFVELNTNTQTFFAAGVIAAIWAGGNVTPDSYGASSASYQVQ